MEKGRAMVAAQNLARKTGAETYVVHDVTSTDYMNGLGAYCVARDYELDDWFAGCAIVAAVYPDGEIDI